MNKSELIDAVAKESGASRAETTRVIEGFTTVVGKALKKGDDVALTGFGRFSVAKRGARRGRNPQTGETLRAAHGAPDNGRLRTRCRAASWTAYPARVAGGSRLGLPGAASGRTRAGSAPSRAAQTPRQARRTI